jgi:multidrug resistance efflux pump
MHKRFRTLVPILAIVIVGAVTVWYLFAEQENQVNGPLEASGTVEAVEVSVAAELSGRVAEVLVGKGDKVEAGEPLLRLDDELLQSQRQRAAAALESANANLGVAEGGVEAAQAALRSAQANAEAILAGAESERLATQQALDELHDTHAVALANASQAIAAANRMVRETEYLLENYSVPTEQASMTALEAVAVMEERLVKARQDFEPYKYASSGDPTRQDLKETLDEAQSDYDTAVRRLEYETAVEQARARLNKAMEDYEKLLDGPDPDSVALLEARLAAIEANARQAQTGVEQAETGVAQAQLLLEQATRAVAQAEAELNLIDVQIKKSSVHAAISGVVLSRNVEPGEIVQAGAPVMTIGQLDQLKITVYVPEDRYGQISLGQEVRVRVDSFPGEVFSASVVYIADKAEFTPRNVQTAEGRRTTVFAVELNIDNREGKLKPGMPADVSFEE